MNRIVALGFFDGVHLGHQALLTACRDLAHRKGYIPAAVTFASHPDTLVMGKTPPLINTVIDRSRFLVSHGMQDIEVLTFDEKLMNTPWQDFLEDLIQKGAAGLFVEMTSVLAAVEKETRNCWKIFAKSGA